MQLGKIFLAAIALFLGMFLPESSQNPAWAGIEVQISSTPKCIDLDAAFSLKIRVINKAKWHDWYDLQYDPPPETFSFNRAAVAYLLPDLTFKGPYEITLKTRTLFPANYPGETDMAEFSIPFQIVGNPSLQSGSMVPVLVMLSQDNFGGSKIVRGFVLVKVK
jgi:hypothetical protein